MIGLERADTVDEDGEEIWPAGPHRTELRVTAVVESNENDVALALDGQRWLARRAERIPPESSPTTRSDWAAILVRDEHYHSTHCPINWRWRRAWA